MILQTAYHTVGREKIDKNTMMVTMAIRRWDWHLIKINTPPIEYTQDGLRFQLRGSASTRSQAEPALRLSMAGALCRHMRTPSNPSWLSNTQGGLKGHLEGSSDFK